MGTNHGVNLFVHRLAGSDIRTSDNESVKFYVEDNIGESIHLHYDDIRLEFSIEEFLKLAEKIETASEEL